MTLQELKDKLNKEVNAAAKVYDAVMEKINSTFAKIDEYESLKKARNDLMNEWEALYESDVVFNIDDSKKHWVYYGGYSTFKNAIVKQMENTQYTEENKQSSIDSIRFLPDVESNDYVRLLSSEVKICMLNVRYDLIITYDTKIEELRVELGIDPDNVSKNKNFKKY